MLKSGLIAAVVALIVGTLFTLISPICPPCVVLFVGLGAGYLAGVFDKLPAQDAAVKAGASAGAIGGVGAVVGQLIGGAINAWAVGPAGAADFIRQWGIPVEAPDPASYWGGLIGMGCCAGLLDVALMTGLGALGGMLWYKMSGSKSVTPSM